MECKCGKVIGTEEEPAYQVRVGHTNEEDEFEPDEDVGYYCSNCLYEIGV